MASLIHRNRGTTRYGIGCDTKPLYGTPPTRLPPIPETQTQTQPGTSSILPSDMPDLSYFVAEWGRNGWDSGRGSGAGSPEDQRAGHSCNSDARDIDQSRLLADQAKLIEDLKKQNSELKIERDADRSKHQEEIARLSVEVDMARQAQHEAQHHAAYLLDQYRGMWAYAAHITVIYHMLWHMHMRGVQPPTPHMTPFIVTQTPPDIAGTVD